MENHQNEIYKTMQTHQYQIRDPIGAGGFASCYTCFSEKYNSVYVVKLMELSAEKKSLPDSFNAEIGALIKVIHPNVVSIYDYFTSEHILYIILEYCTGGSLDQVIKSQGRIDPPELYSICKQVITALLVVHSLGIAHRDIKPQNILLDNNRRPKLADFGLAQQITKNELSERFSGSLPFKSPEILNMKPYDPFLGDVWALGVTFYLMAYGELPWKANTLSDWKLLIESGCTAFPHLQHKSLGQFNIALRKMMEPNVKDRATLQEIANMPIFSEANLPVLRTSSKHFLSNTSSVFQIPNIKTMNQNTSNTSQLAAVSSDPNSLNASLNIHSKKQTRSSSLGTAGMTALGKTCSAPGSSNLKHSLSTVAPIQSQGAQMARIVANKPNVGSSPAPSMNGVYTWKRRCSRVSRLINFTFNEEDEKKADA